MNRLFSSFALAFIFFGLLDSALADPVDFVYLNNGLGRSQFGTMDLATGVFSLIGNTTTTYSAMTRLPGGPLYAVDNTSRLLLLNTATGGINSVVGTMGSGIEGAVLSSAGTMYAFNASNLYTVNTSNASVTLVGAFGLSGALYSASFDKNTMYLQESSFAGAKSKLYTVNTSTGLATQVGTGNTGFEITTTDFENSTLYGFTTGSQVVTINTSTGAGILLLTQGTGQVLSAATAAAAVPEPASLCLFAIGVGLVCMSRSRMRRVS